MKWIVGAVAFFLTLLSTAVVAEGPLPVSPGGQAGVAVVSGRCPTFNWTAVEGAQSVDLVVYRLPKEESDDQPVPVLSVSLPGSAHGWTPSLGQCLESGQRYAWSVRATGESGEIEWSEASLFEVSLAPSVAAVEDAIAVLRRYVAIEGSGEGAAGAADLGTVEPERRRPEVERESHRISARTGAAGREARAGVEEPAPPAQTPAPTLGDASLTVDQQLHLGSASDVFKDDLLFLWSDSDGNLGVGSRGLESNTLGIENTAVGADALRDNTTGSANTAVGEEALRDNTSGFSNTAVGENALKGNESGSENTAVGDGTLRNNFNGSFNTAVGFAALMSNTTGSDNTAVGPYALTSAIGTQDNTAVGKDALRFLQGGNENTAVGERALRNSTIGHHNTAVGDDALQNTNGYNNVAVGDDALNNSTGNNNIAVGQAAGTNVTSGSSNIHIGNAGLSGDGATIKIGTLGTHTSTYIAGVYGVAVGATNHVVYADSTGKLGEMSSSLRFKEDVRDMGGVSARLLDLRPVTFRFREASSQGREPRQFGLIAEEVAEVLPELVTYDDQGQPKSVRYNLLSTMLLNEVQRQQGRIRLQGWLLGVMLLAGVAVAIWRLA